MDNKNIAKSFLKLFDLDDFRPRCSCKNLCHARSSHPSIIVNERTLQKAYQLIQQGPEIIVKGLKELYLPLEFGVTPFYDITKEFLDLSDYEYKNLTTIKPVSMSEATNPDLFNTGQPPLAQKYEVKSDRIEYRTKTIFEHGIIDYKIVQRSEPIFEEKNEFTTETYTEKIKTSNIVSKSRILTRSVKKTNTHQVLNPTTGRMESQDFHVDVEEPYTEYYTETVPEISEVTKTRRIPRLVKTQVGENRIEDKVPIYGNISKQIEVKTRVTVVTQLYYFLRFKEHKSPRAEDCKKCKCPFCQGLTTLQVRPSFTEQWIAHFTKILNSEIHLNSSFRKKICFVCGGNHGFCNQWRYVRIFHVETVGESKSSDFELCEKFNSVRNNQWSYSIVETNSTSHPCRCLECTLKDCRFWYESFCFKKIDHRDDMYNLIISTIKQSFPGFTFEPDLRISNLIYSLIDRQN